jgi:hypothetical protein
MFFTDAAKRGIAHACHRGKKDGSVFFSGNFQGLIHKISDPFPFKKWRRPRIPDGAFF